jgi:hypothetical protein
VRPSGSKRTAFWLFIAYSLAVSLFSLSGADAPDVFLLDLVFIPWIVGPAVIAAACVSSSMDSRGAWSFVVLEVAIILSTLVGWLDLTFLHRDAQNGVIIGLVMPLWQYGAVLIAVAAARIAGWRIPPGWPD